MDCIADDIMDEEVFARMEKLKPGLAIINTVTPTIDSDMVFAETFKQRFPDCFTVVFGTHVTVLHREIMEKFSRLDGVLLHEPEWTAIDLAAILERGDLPEGGLPGCILRIGDRIVVGPERPYREDLDSMGVPDWSFFDTSKYMHPVLGKPYLTVNTSRGCKHNCIFCVGHIFYGKKMRYRSVMSIADEIAMIKKQYKVNLIWFYADDFTSSPDFVKDLCREIIRRKLNIVWWTNTRVDRPDEEMFRLMKDAGCYMLSIGGESGNAEILATIRKGTKPQFIKNTVELLRKTGINSMVYFLIGLPGETRNTIRETIIFAKSINPDYVEFYPATPYPGTEFHRIAVEKGRIVNQDWSAFMCGGNQFVIEIPGVGKNELDGILRSAYREFYIRPAYLLMMARRILCPAEFLRLAIFGIGYMTRFFRSGK